jgi:hypothetical protein
MDAIGPEIRLRLAPGEPLPEPREWQGDARQGTLVHVPTGATFQLYAVSAFAIGAGRSGPIYHEANMRARLVRVRDDAPMPSPTEIDELGRAAIRRFLAVSSREFGGDR